MSLAMLTTSLEGLATALEGQTFKAQFIDQWGWQAAPFSVDDLAVMSRQIAADLNAIDWSKAPGDVQRYFADLAAKVDKAKTVVVPSITSGYMTLDAIMNTLVGLELLIRGYVTKDVVMATLKSTSTFGRRIDLASSQLDTAINKIDGLEVRTEKILKAASIAEKLDVTMHELDEALKQVSSAQQRALKLQIEAEGSVREATKSQELLAHIATEASAVMRKVDIAYGAATTEGLAKAFDEKAKRLNGSVIWWVFVLVAALAVGVFVGHERFPVLMKALESRPDWSVVTMHMVISALSLGPGIWLAWIATKQIGQRFRLAEDYAYKASLAKAYEGYRAQAANLDPMFTSQLFAIALGRLEELPLRTIDRDVAGSPLNDLMQSKEFRDQLEQLPNLKDTVVRILERSVPQPLVNFWTGKKNEDKKQED
ncbi:MAG: hypothetical protein MUF44_09135 [Hydrogenophaga sp.]|jgi:hypothetical protein|nr:hypothetical protein [Hydrogenophaga sp.]